jgi:hypothetical protein
MFSKGTYQPNVEIAVVVPMLSDAQFVFTFPKRLSESAAKEQQTFLGMSADAPDDYRKQLIKTVSEMIVKEPSGIEDFPMDARPLPMRFTEYFDAPEQPELESVLVSAWRAYAVASVPSVRVVSRAA